MDKLKRAFSFTAMAVVVVSCAGMLQGCGHASLQPFAGKNLQVGAEARMAVLSFDNLSKTQGAGKSMENIILTEFLKKYPARILDPGEVAAALSEERVRLATSIPRETIQALGKRLGVSLFLVGVVHEYEMQMGGGASGSQAPVIALTIRIISAETGEIVWAINAARSGSDKETLFGIGRIKSLNSLAEDMAQDIAQAFARSLKK